jgi:hypothetical protein
MARPQSSWFATGAANIVNAWAAGFPVRAHNPTQVLGSLSAA